MKEAFISIGCALISGFVAWIVAKQAAQEIANNLGA